MDNLYEDLEFEVVIQCPVCLEIPSGIIYLCKIGHHVCETCRGKLSLCPTCESPLSSCRNFLAETLINKIAILKGGGDARPPSSPATQDKPATVIQLADNNDTLKALVLPSGVYMCLLESCRNRKTKTWGVGNLFPHVSGVHPHLFDKFSNKIATFTHNFENFCLLKKKHKFHRAFHVSNMGLFFLNIEVLEDLYINCWLSAPAPPKHTKNLAYQLDFSKEADDTKISFIGKMASNMQTKEWLHQRGGVFVIPPSEHKLHFGHFFSLLIKIVYKPPTVNSLEANSP